METHTSWVWPDQIDNREDYPYFENKQGTKIFIAPRRYIIQLKKKAGGKNIEENPEAISACKSVITPVHNYRYAPEPLKSLVSIFQLLGHNGGKDIYLYLTNISSQKLRKDLIGGLLQVLEEDYKPKLIWIQTGTASQQPKVYEAESIEQILTTITEKQENLITWTGNAKHPWTFKATTYLSHVAQGKDQAVVPEREAATKIAQGATERNIKKQAILNKIFKKRAARQPSMSLSDEELLETVNDLENNITHSSSTRGTKRKDGRESPQPGPSKRRASSHSITETTTTSYTPATREEETQQDRGEESPSILVSQLREAQKALAAFPQLDFSGITFNIVSATVSNQSISMEIKSTRN